MLPANWSCFLLLSSRLDSRQAERWVTVAWNQPPVLQLNMPLSCSRHALDVLNDESWVLVWLCSLVEVSHSLRGSLTGSEASTGCMTHLLSWWSSWHQRQFVGKAWWGIRTNRTVCGVEGGGKGEKIMRVANIREIPGISCMTFKTIWCLASLTAMDCMWINDS